MFKNNYTYTNNNKSSNTYANNSQNSFENQQNNTHSNTQETNYNQPNVDNNYEDMINKYSSYNQDDLLKELHSQASMLKSQGKLDNNTLLQMKNTIMPMINPSQIETLDKIINDLL